MLSTIKKALSPRMLLRARALDAYLRGSSELRHLKYWCDSSRNSIDVGANVGIYSYLMGYHSTHVYAYEPNPDLAAYLGQACDYRVTVLQKALSDQRGTATLRIPTYDGVEMHGLASLEDIFSGDEQVRSVDVPLTRLDDEGHKDIGFIKIDVEQHEISVLMGALGLIERDKPTLLIEVTPKLYEHSLPEMFSNLLDLGYRGYFLFAGKLQHLKDYDMSVHNAPRNYGRSNFYVTNVVFCMGEPSSAER